MDKKEIKAVEMVREIRDRFYEQTKDMSREELMAFVAREAERMDKEAAAIRKRAAGRSAA